MKRKLSVNNNELNDIQIYSPPKKKPKLSDKIIFNDKNNDISNQSKPKKGISKRVSYQQTKLNWFMDFKDNTSNNDGNMKCNNINSINNDSDYDLKENVNEIISEYQGIDGCCHICGRQYEYKCYLYHAYQVPFNLKKNKNITIFKPQKRYPWYCPYCIKTAWEVSYGFDGSGTELKSVNDLIGQQNIEFNFDKVLEKNENKLHLHLETFWSGTF